jgi:hypothetical protein
MHLLPAMITSGAARDHLVVWKNVTRLVLGLTFHTFVHRPKSM